MKKKMTLANRSKSAASEERISASRLALTLWRGRYVLIGSFVLCLAFAIYYISVTPKQYRADALLQIKANSQDPLANVSAGQSMGAAASLFGIGPNSAAESEIPIILSRAVTGPTVRDLALDVKVTPVSSAWTDILGNSSDSQAVADQIRVASFNVPSSLIGHPFALHVKSLKAYELYGPEGDKIATGSVGKKIVADASGHSVSVKIASIPERAVGRRYSVVRNHRLSAEHSLSGSLLVQVETPSTNILSISLAANDPEKSARIVNSVIDNYVQYGRKAAEKNAQKSLQFIKDQLPRLKSKLNDAESKLAKYQKNNQPVDLSAAGQALLQQDTSLKSNVTQTKMHIAELKQQYTGDFPELQAAQDQLSSLRKQHSELEKKVKKLPGNQQEMLGLQRRVEVYTQLYTALLQRAQQLRVMQAAAIDNTHVVDRAVTPIEPVWPRTKLLLLVAGVFGLLIGSALVLLRFALREGVRDSRVIERFSKVRVFATLPFSPGLKRASDRAISQGRIAPIATRDNLDQALVRSFRDVRAGLFAESSSADAQTVIVSSMGESDGTTFLAVHLAHLLSLSRRRVVIVGTEFVSGGLERYLESMAPGGKATTLSQFLTQDDVQGGLDAETPQQLPGTGIDVIPAGRFDDDVPEPLYHPRFSKLMAGLHAHYDDVLVVSGSIANGDATILGAVCGESRLLLAVQSGCYSQEKIDQVVQEQRARGVVFAGLVLNENAAS